MLEKINLLEIGFSNVTPEEVLEYIVKSLKKSSKKYYVVTPNPEILVIASNDEFYTKVLNSAKIALADGAGVVWASKFLGKPLKHRITGVDLLEKLCEGVAEKPITVGFLGGGPKIAETTAECLKGKYPGLKVTFASSEFHNHESITKIPATDILFVAFGSPKQEIWIYENLNRLSVKVVIGVGGAFDFISGKVKRAPLWVRSLGFEWLFRLIIQPWRIKRQISLVTFILLVFKERFFTKSIKPRK